MSEREGLPEGLDPNVWSPIAYGDWMRICHRELTLAVYDATGMPRYFCRTPPVQNQGQPQPYDCRQSSAAEAQDGFEIPGHGRWKECIAADCLSRDMSEWFSFRDGPNVYHFCRIPDPAPEQVDWDTADWETCGAYLVEKGLLDSTWYVHTRWETAGRVIPAMQEHDYQYRSYPSGVSIGADRQAHQFCKRPGVTKEHVSSAEHGDSPLAVLRSAAKALQAEQGGAP